MTIRNYQSGRRPATHQDQAERPETSRTNRQSRRQRTCRARCLWTSYGLSTEVAADVGARGTGTSTTEADPAPAAASARCFAFVRRFQ